LPRIALSEVDRSPLQAMALETDKPGKIGSAASQPKRPARRVVWSSCPLD
jgi:hypothetical protein